MSLVSLAMNVLLALLLMAALAMGWRLNRRLKTLRESHEGFAVAVRELNTAAGRAEQGLADLRAATDEAVDLLSDRIEKGRALAAKLEKLVQDAPAVASRREPPADPDLAQERRLGALLAAAREARARPERLAHREPAARPKPAFEDDLFDDPAPEPNLRGARR
ncbi:DUF6468 domain-containing protein [Phenylobacterium sp. LjRoot219]|uniref:DUF6468 domain-containing protein n=1 Tax=Phenylobacterium sp. LjRoot219 TaxID=3342283 RepID=UPI003ED15429